MNCCSVILDKYKALHARPYFNIITGGEIAPPVNFFAPPMKIFRAYVNDFVWVNSTPAELVKLKYFRYMVKI